ncbi:arsenical pump-driving ATPase [Massilia sp. TS11]|nr:arsenical pump-driving ATPase [Massilia sp. TS11]
MQFLEGAPVHLFFTGKGGVGKTSVACASAVQLADAGKRVLLVSTDPASNLGQVFGQAIGNRVTPIADVARLDAIELDPQQAAQQYRDRIVGPVRGVLPDDVVRSVEEQLSGACTTEIAAFDEFTRLLTDAALMRQYDHILFDTAPTGHTIRLLQLPSAWSDFLETGKGDASCLGPLAGLDQHRSQYAAAVQALTDTARTRLVLVARAQKSSLQELVHTCAELQAVGMGHQYLVLNGVFPQEAAAQDPLALAIVAREQQALAAMPEVLRPLRCDRLALRPFNLLGLAALRAFFDDAAPAPVSHAAHDLAALHGPDLDSLVEQIAADGHGLIMVMGKGGVGKTTVAAAIALALAERGHAVHLTTSDPAAHVAATLNAEVANVQVSRIDPQAATERYREAVMNSKGRDLDESGRAMLAEDLRSPCTEEIAVFQAFSRVIREAGQRFVVMDTAPTGHTLLLLDATGAYHRDVVRQMGERGLHFRTPLMQLQDPQQTKVLITTLPESTPVLEAAQLQADLGRAGIHPWAWVVNNSVAFANPQAPLLAQRAANELPLIRRVAEELAPRWAAIPLLAEEPVGPAALRLVCRHGKGPQRG